jgi:hypothetical protein
MVLEWIEKVLLTFVRRNVDGRIVGNLFRRHFVNLLGFGAGDRVLKIAPSDITTCHSLLRSSIRTLNKILNLSRMASALL